MRRGGWITGVGCMVPFIAAGLWIGLQTEVPECFCAAVNRAIGRDRLYPVLVNGKVGYIDRSGKLIVPARYEPTGRIGLDATTRATCFESPLTGLVFWDKRRIDWARDFSEGRGAIKTSVGWQVIDGTGRELLAKPVDWVRDFSKGRVAIRVGEGWQVIDSTGQELLTKPVDDLGECQHGLAWFRAAGRYGLLDHRGKIRVPAKLLSKPNFAEGVWVVQYREYWSVVDAQGDPLTATRYDYIRPASDGMLSVSMNRKWGFIDIWGEEVIPCKFDRTGRFYGGYARTKTGATCAWIDKSGRGVARPQRPQLQQYDDGLSMVAKGKLFGLKDAYGRWVVPPLFKHIGRFDCTGSHLTRPVTFALPPSAPVSVVSACEAVAAGWNQAVKSLKDLNGVYEPSPPRLAVVQTADGKWGILDMYGRLCCKGLDGWIVRERGLRFYEGFAMVTRGNKVGFVDETGRIAIEPQFDYAEDFNGGLSRFIMGVSHRDLYGDLTNVKTAKWGYVDRTGKIVWKPTR